MTEERCHCGFPLLDGEERCIACLPPQFRQAIGRYNNKFPEMVIENSSAS